MEIDEAGLSVFPLPCQLHITFKVLNKSIPTFDPLGQWNDPFQGIRGQDDISKNQYSLSDHDSKLLARGPLTLIPSCHSNERTIATFGRDRGCKGAALHATLSPTVQGGLVIRVLHMSLAW